MDVIISRMFLCSKHFRMKWRDLFDDHTLNVISFRRLYTTIRGSCAVLCINPKIFDVLSHTEIEQFSRHFFYVQHHINIHVFVTFGTWRFAIITSNKRDQSIHSWRVYMIKRIILSTKTQKGQWQRNLCVQVVFNCVFGSVQRKCFIGISFAVGHG